MKKKLVIYGQDGKFERIVNPAEKAVIFAEKFIKENSAKLKIAGDEKVSISIGGHIEQQEVPEVYVKFGLETATYLLETRKPLKEDLTETTKKEVDQWFDLNQGRLWKQWQESHKDKLRFTLSSSKNETIEVFSGKRGGNDFPPMIRIYYKGEMHIIRLLVPESISLLPMSIRDQMGLWIEANYEAIIVPWRDSITEDHILMDGMEEKQPLNEPFNFWTRLKNKQRFELTFDGNKMLEIFAGRRYSGDLVPNIRLYYLSQKWFVDLQEPESIQSLPAYLREEVQEWIDLNYEKIKRPWPDTPPRERSTYGINIPREPVEPFKFNFWTMLKNWL